MESDKSKNDFEYTYNLNYGINSTTYIEIKCPYNDIDSEKVGYYCYFMEFQDIDIINGKLYFLGCYNHPGFEKMN